MFRYLRTWLLLTSILKIQAVTNLVSETWQKRPSGLRHTPRPPVPEEEFTSITYWETPSSNTLRSMLLESRSNDLPAKPPSGVSTWFRMECLSELLRMISLGRLRK